MAALLSGIPYYTTRSNSLSSVKFLTNYYFPGMGGDLAGRESFQRTSNAEKIFVQFVQGAENLLEFLGGHFCVSFPSINAAQFGQLIAAPKFSFRSLSKLQCLHTALFCL